MRKFRPTPTSSEMASEKVFSRFVRGAEEMIALHLIAFLFCLAGADGPACDGFKPLVESKPVAAENLVSTVNPVLTVNTPMGDTRDVGR